MTTPINYHDLFGPPELAKYPPADDQLIAWAEAELGVVLPKAYKDLVKARNGAYLFYRAIIPTEHQPEPDTSRKAYTLRKIDGIDTGGSSSIVYHTTLARDEWGGPDGLVAFEGEGHWWLCLDYRDCGPTGEPTVVHCDNGSESASGENEWFTVAPTFDSFVRGLHIDHGGNYMLAVSGLTRQEIRDRVASLPNKPHPYAHPDFMAVCFTDYQGTDITEHADILPGEPNREFEDPRSTAHARSLLGLRDDELDIPVSVAHDQAEELINKLLDLLSPHARLVHCPIDGAQILPR